MEATIEFPWFLVGFLILSILGSCVFNQSIPVSDNVIDGVSAMTTWLLTAAMVGLGLNVSLKGFMNKSDATTICDDDDLSCVGYTHFYDALDSALEQHQAFICMKNL